MAAAPLAVETPRMLMHRLLWLDWMRSCALLMSIERTKSASAASSLAGGRIASALKDTPVAYSVITKEFLDAFNVQDVVEASMWSTNANLVEGDNGTRMYGRSSSEFVRQRGIKNLIVMGVHTNMCVLGRPFGIRQMVRQGINVALMRDMTDSMYNPAMKPQGSHFRGTELVIEHIERHWCPTITSSDFTGKGAFRFREDARPRVEIIVGGKEHDCDESLANFAHLLRDQHGYYVEEHVGPLAHTAQRPGPRHVRPDPLVDRPGVLRPPSADRPDDQAFIRAGIFPRAVPGEFAEHRRADEPGGAGQHHAQRSHAASRWGSTGNENFALACGVATAGSR